MNCKSFWFGHTCIFPPTRVVNTGCSDGNRKRPGCQIRGGETDFVVILGRCRAFPMQHDEDSQDRNVKPKNIYIL